jgi:hypothetical protein
VFEREIALQTFLLGYLKMLTADVSEEDLDRRPIAGMNPPRWILTHLAICTDYAARALGGEMARPKTWHRAYGPGAPPTAAVDPLPSKSELISAFEAGVHRVNELAAKADRSALAAPHGLAILEGTPIRTKEEFVAHLMTTHAAGHLGHLSCWRRAMGRAPLF